MNIKEIEELIKFVAKTGVSEVELQIKDFKLIVKTNPKGKETLIQTTTQPIAQSFPINGPPLTTSVQQIPQPEKSTSPSQTATKEEANLITIKSPMIGTFYRTPSPDKPAFVNVGDEIKQGKVLCIIEAMKLFNEIESEVAGRIVKVLVENASPVEYDQPLFLVEPL